MYELLGVCLILATLLAVNALASHLAALAWRLFGRCTSGRTAVSRANLLFRLRILPVFIATSGAVFILLPAYIAYEPRHTGERIGFTLAVMALISGIGLILAFLRGIQAWLSTRRLLADWLRHSDPVTINGFEGSTYRLNHVYPIVALVGTIRPRLFIADCVLRSLTSNELEAVITHERAHLTENHNFKRALLRICFDVLTLIPGSRVLDHEWTNASEEAADEYAAGKGPEFALHMASALLRIARMAPSGVKLAVPVTVSLAESANIASRVTRLVQLASKGGPGRIPSVLRAKTLNWMFASAPLVAAVWVVVDRDRLRVAHDLIEAVVATLR